MLEFKDVNFKKPLLGSIPKKLSKLYMELVAANPEKRPNPKERIETMRRGGNYFKNELIDTLLFLEEVERMLMILK